MTSASKPCAAIASNTVPFTPRLPSSVATYTSPCFLKSSSKNASSRKPSTICFLQLSRLDSSKIGGIPIPPPIKKAALSFKGNPFPKGPKAAMRSPASICESSFVPSPATRNTRRRERLSSPISQMLMGRGKSLLPSLQDSIKNCPGPASFASSSTRSHTSKMPGAISFF